MLEVCGVTEVRAQYWEAYNAKKDSLAQTKVESLNIKEFQKDFLRGVNKFSSQVNENKDEQISIQPTVSEEFIASAIPDQLLAVMQTTLLLKVEM